MFSKLRKSFERQVRVFNEANSFDICGIFKLARFKVNSILIS